MVSVRNNHEGDRFREKAELKTGYFIYFIFFYTGGHHIGGISRSKGDSLR